MRRRVRDAPMLLSGWLPLASTAPQASNFTKKVRVRKRRLLVSYVYTEARHEARANLEFFLEVGMPAEPRWDVCTGLVVNGYNISSALPVRTDLLVLRRENAGYDYGAHMAMLEHVSLEAPSCGPSAGSNSSDGAASPSASREELALRAQTREGLASLRLPQRLFERLHFTHFIFLNCGVRGPFLPAHWPASVHWSSVYLDKLTHEAKLVGTSIVCLPHNDPCVKHDPGCFGPKVEGYAWATDAVGLGVLLRKRTVFRQHATKVDAIFDGEYGATRAIFAAGYTIDTPLLAYQGVDWRRESSCNKNMHPSREGSYFGISQHPLETIFHKTWWAGSKESDGYVHKDEVDMYTRWAIEGARRQREKLLRAKNKNDYAPDDPTELCYARRYPDLYKAYCPGSVDHSCDLSRLRLHWKKHGQAEGRRYLCGMPAPPVLRTEGRSTSESSIWATPETRTVDRQQSTTNQHFDENTERE